MSLGPSSPTHSMPDLLLPGGGRWDMALLALSLILAELLWTRLRREEGYDLGETAASLGLSLGGRVVSILSAALLIAPLTWIHQFRLFDLPAGSLWAFLLVFVLVDVCEYWHHRLAHRVRFLWAFHAVHHSSTELNLSAAIRLGWGAFLFGGILFYLPLLLLGFTPAQVLGALALNLAFQFFLHARWAPRLGPLEWLFNTPRHHRVHHASNAACLDRNFAGVFIVIDRLFGTFAAAPAGEALRFGLTGGDRRPTRKPLAILLLVWRQMAVDLRRAGDWRSRGAAVFGRP